MTHPVPTTVNMADLSLQSFGPYPLVALNCYNRVMASAEGKKDSKAFCNLKSKVYEGENDGLDENGNFDGSLQGSSSGAAPPV